SAAFVLGTGRHLLGVVHDSDVLRQVKAGDRDLSKIIQPSPAVVSPDAPLMDLFEMAVSSPLPVAVTDDKDRLIGAIPRVTLLASLGNVDTTSDDVDIVVEPPATIPVDIITETLRATADS